MSDTPTPYSKVQRLLLTVLGGLGVAALAAGTFVLSYDDLRALAILGGAVRRWAFLYPAMIDGLVVVIILSILTARRAGWWPRAVRWVLLLALVAGAGAAGVQRAVEGYDALPHTWVSGGVAAAPWVLLTLAVWLWTSMIKQALSLRARRRRSRPEPAEPGPPTLVERAVIPGLTDYEMEDTRPLPRHTPARELEPGRAEPQPVAAPTGRSPAEPAPLRTERSPAEPAPLRTERSPAEPAPLRTERSPAEPAPLPTRPAAPGERAQAGPVPPPAASHDTTAPSSPARPATPREQAEPGPAPPSAAPGDSIEPAPPAADPAVPRAGSGPGSMPVSTASHGPAKARPEPEPHLAEDARMPDTAAEPTDDRPASRMVARTSLPTDVMLVGGSPNKPTLADTQPDGIKLPDTQPDGIPMVGTADEEDDAYTDERAEDPDAGDGASGVDPWGERAEQAPAHWGAGTPGRRRSPGNTADEEMESTPPSSKFRSSPTPPRD